MESIEYQRMREAEDRHWWYVGLHDLVLGRIRREAGRCRRSLNILDAGCGTGRLCQLMQPFGSVTGCDAHPLAITATVNRGVRNVFPCDLVSGELAVEEYDLITCMDVLYHRRVTDDAAVLRNLRRALRPGGLLLVNVAAFECLRGAHDVAVHTQRRYRHRELVRLLETAGLEIESISYRLPLFMVPALLWRHASRCCMRQDADHSDMIRECPGGVNCTLASLIRMENRLLLAGWQMPFGTSLFASARRRVSDLRWIPRPRAATHAPRDPGLPVPDADTSAGSKCPG